MCIIKSKYRAYRLIKIRNINIYVSSFYYGLRNFKKNLFLRQNRYCSMRFTHFALFPSNNHSKSRQDKTREHKRTYSLVREEKFTTQEKKVVNRLKTIQEKLCSRQESLNGITTFNYNRLFLVILPGCLTLKNSDFFHLMMDNT